MSSIYTLEVLVEFDSHESREKFVSQLIHAERESEDAIIKSKKYRVRHTHCVRCGIPRHMGTLGSGINGVSANECRPSFWQQCQRRVMKLLESEQNVVPPS